MNWNKVLVVGPHTDDAELGCGGTIARLLEEGVDVYVSVFSTAADSLPPGAPPTLLQDEFLKAMCFLGVPKSNLTIHNYKVRKLSYYRQEVLEDLVKQSQEIQPDAVFVPSGNDLHQDHQVTYAEGLRAFRNSTILGYELPWNHITFSAQAFFILQRRHLDKKCQVLRIYKSQWELHRSYFSREFQEGLARMRGVQIRSEYAEAFEVIRVRF